MSARPTIIISHLPRGWEPAEISLVFTDSRMSVITIKTDDLGAGPFLRIEAPDGIELDLDDLDWLAEIGRKLVEAHEAAEKGAKERRA